MDEASNEVAIQLLEAAKAHCYYFFFKCIKRKVKGVNFSSELPEKDKEGVGKVLHKVAALFALTNILDDNWNEIFEIG